MMQPRIKHVTKSNNIHTQYLLQLAWQYQYLICLSLCKVYYKNAFRKPIQRLTMSKYEVFLWFHQKKFENLTKRELTSAPMSWMERMVNFEYSKMFQ